MQMVLAAVLALWSLTNAQKAQIDNVVTTALARQHVAGAEVGIGRDGFVLYKKGYGYRDVARRLPVTANTLFPIGSITKQFTAACVILLVQSGAVDLDADISRYLPDAPHGDEITVRELLDQTSGLPNYGTESVYAEMASGSLRPRGLADVLALVAGKPLHFAPGTKFEYSDTNYMLLGEIVQRTSGHSYSGYLALHVFDPLGLANTHYLESTAPIVADQTRGYDYANGAYRLVPFYGMGWGGAAGAIASTVSDLVAWDGSFFSGGLIAQRYVALATTPPAGVGAGNPLCAGYGFGWCVGRANERKIVWHNGAIVGGRTLNAVFPRHGIAVVILTNVNDASPEPLAIQIDGIVEGAH